MPERRAYDEITRIGKALASPTRLELLDLLAQRPRSVDELAGLADASVANTSQHLKVLREANLVETEKRGRQVICRLAPGVSPFIVSLHELAVERLPALAALARELHEGKAAALEPRALLRSVRGGEVVVLDVRPEDEFQAGHLRGARSLPLEELRERLSELPADKEVVAYCRGPWCVMARDAVTLLRSHGFSAQPLELGVAELRERGYPIEGSAA